MKKEISPRTYRFFRNDFIKTDLIIPYLKKRTVTAEQNIGEAVFIAIIVLAAALILISASIIWLIKIICSTRFRKEVFSVKKQPQASAEVLLTT